MNESSETNLHFLDYWRVLKYRWPFVLIAFLLVTGIAGVTCYFIPRQYYSEVLLEVKPDKTGMQIFGNEDGFKMPTESRLAATQFQIIQSKEILYPVIERLRLNESWAPPGQRYPMEVTYWLLRKKMNESDQVRGTDLLHVGIYSTDAKEAADIANAIANIYTERRRTDQLEQIKQGLVQLEDEVQKKRQDVEKAQEKMHQIMVDEEIVDLNPESMDAVNTPANSIVELDEAKINEHKVLIAELRAQLEQTEKLKSEELITALGILQIEDSTVAKALPLYQDAVVEEARMLNSGLGENHPRVKALRAQKDVLANQLMEQIQAVRGSLATRLRVEETTLEALTKKLDDSKQTLNKTRRQSANYANAKSSYLRSKSIFEAAEGRLETQRMQMGMSVYPAKIWANAEPALAPAWPNVFACMGFSMFGGLMTGLLIAFFLEYLDTSVKTIEDVEKLLNVSVLGVIPKGISALIKSGGDSPDAEAYRILQTNLDLNRKDPNGNTITLVSGGVGEGKSTTINNLAYTYARAGHKVLVVDADLRRSSQHLYFGVEKTNGLSDILMGQIRVEDAIRQGPISNLWFIPSGELQDSSRGILHSQQMADFINEVKPHYDLIFFDSPPILGLSDASVLTSLVDLTLMVVQYRRFPRSMLKRVKQSVIHSKGNLIGAVLNNVDTQRDTNYQYYTQYYDYYRPGSGKESRKPKALEEAAPRPGDY